MGKETTTNRVSGMWNLSRSHHLLFYLRFHPKAQFDFAWWLNQLNFKNNIINNHVISFTHQNKYGVNITLPLPPAPEKKKVLPGSLTLFAPWNFCHPKRKAHRLPTIHFSGANCETGWWFQPIRKILVKMGSSSPNRGEHIKYLKPPARWNFRAAKFHLHHLHLGAPFPTPWRKIPPRWPPPGRSSALSPGQKTEGNTGVLSTPVLNLHRFLGKLENCMDFQPWISLK